MSQIGFFDSGVGGATVMREARRLLPREDFLYYGDTLHAPYGTKSDEEILRLSRDAARFLVEKGVKALVIACNTASAAAAAQLRRELSIPIIAIEPALKPAHFLRKDGAVLVLATEATLRLEKFGRLMALYGEGAVPIPGTGLVELIEADRADSPECEALLRRLIGPHLAEPVDAIVLGCTHYVFLRPLLSRIAPGVPVVDGHLGTARQLVRVLQEKNLLEDGAGRTEFCSSAGEESVAIMRRMYENVPLSEN